jgi:two-component system sensor histidine kinase KdpD
MCAHRTWPWRRAHIRRIAAGAPDIDLIEMGEAAHQATAPLRKDRTPQVRNGWGYLWATLSSLATALAATPLLAYLDLANIAMLFLLVVVLVAVRFGRGPSVVATCVSVACFDFFFVPPRFTLAISDFQYGITFVVMLVVGLITGHLTAGLRFQARVAGQREGRARALYEFARELSGALQTEQIFDTTRDVVQRAFRAQAILLLPDAEGRLQAPVDAPLLDLGIAQWAFDHATSAGLGTDTLPASTIFYLPLVAPMRTRGILAITPDQPRWMLIPEQRQQLDTFAALAAIALERVHYIEVAQDALVNMESERLRNALLAALSHDLRTPLTSLVGLSETLAASKPPLAAAQLSMARALHDEARRMSTLVTNLLDMARIQSGEVTFNLAWQDVEEMVGGALRISAAVLKDHVVATSLAPGLPLLHVDAVLIERVLCNLLENAAKYTPAGSRIVVAAQEHGAWVQLTVSDNGPGLPPGREEALFEKFTRGERESNKPGVGLGLAICRAIVEAHGGTIRAGAAQDGGAAFIVSLPRGTPPAPPLENLDE